MVKRIKDVAFADGFGAHEPLASAELLNAVNHLDQPENGP